MITVAQLIKLLRKCDQSAVVATASHDQSENETDGFVARVAEMTFGDLNETYPSYGPDTPLVVIR